MKKINLTDSALVFPVLAAALALSSCTGEDGIVEPKTEYGTVYVEGARASADPEIAAMEPSAGAVVDPIDAVVERE